MADIDAALRTATSVKPLDLPKVKRKPKAPAPVVEAKPAAAPAAQEGEFENPGRIPTRLVTSKKNKSEKHHHVTMEAFRETPELFNKNIDVLRNYPNLRQEFALRPHDEVANEMVRHIKDNLLYLHDQTPEHIRNRSKLWYDGARNIVNNWMKEYQLPDHSIAGALAALSPQKDWYQNVSLAKRVLDAMHTGHNSYKGQVFDPEMLANFKGRAALNKPAYDKLLASVNGKSLHDIDQMGLPPKERATLKALWIRMYDETHNDNAYPIVTPEGGFGEPVQTTGKKKANAKVAWGSLNEISKAVQAIEAAHDPEQLSRLMGERHKVRNFYNNILDPNSHHGDVTIDTHAVAAGLLRPLSGNSVEVNHNFGTYAGKGQPSTGGSAITGIQGLYPLYAEAYRQAAKERGIKPREMQSITWEAVRGLFPDKWKTKKNNAKVNDIWSRYRSGELSQDEARRLVHDEAGGITPPTWFAGTDEANRGAADAGALSQSGVSGGTAQGTVAGRGRRTTPTVPTQEPEGAPVV